MTESVHCSGEWLHLAWEGDAEEIYLYGHVTPEAFFDAVAIYQGGTVAPDNFGAFPVFAGPPRQVWARFAFAGRRSVAEVRRAAAARDAAWPGPPRGPPLESCAPPGPPPMPHDASNSASYVPYVPPVPFGSGSEPRSTLREYAEAGPGRFKVTAAKVLRWECFEQCDAHVGDDPDEPCWARAGHAGEHRPYQKGCTRRLWDEWGNAFTCGEPAYMVLPEGEPRCAKHDHHEARAALVDQPARHVGRTFHIVDDFGWLNLCWQLLAVEGEVAILAKRPGGANPPKRAQRRRVPFAQLRWPKNARPERDKETA